MGTDISKYQRLYDAASTLRDDGDYLGAINLLLQEIEKGVTDPKIYILVSNCMLLADRLEDAQQKLNFAKKFDLKTPEVEWVEVRILLKKNLISEALKLATETNKKFPNDLEGMVVLGTSFRANKKYSEGIIILSEALKSEPENVTALVNRGLIYLALKKHHEALQDLEKAFKLRPHLKQIWDLLITLELEFERFVEAKSILQQIIERSPENPKYLFVLGNCNLHLNEFHDAEIAFKRALDINSNFCEAHTNLGVSLKEQGKIAEAISSYRRALNINPEFHEALSNLGIALKEEGQLEQAVEAYHKALEIRPNSASILTNLGVVFLLQGKLKDAILMHENALQIDPKSAEAFTNLGISLNNAGKQIEAIAAFKNAITINKDFANAHRNLSYSLLNNGQLREGLSQYEWRWKTSEFFTQARTFKQPILKNSEGLSGKKILLWHEQGVGDTINWSSCIPIVTKLASSCIVECPEKLVPLIRYSFPDVTVRTSDHRHDLDRSDFDVHLPMGSLYLHFLDEFLKSYSNKAYLTPNPEKVEIWRNRLREIGDGPFVGISWKSSKLSAQRAPNYADLQEWQSLLSLTQINFINLQSGNVAHDLDHMRMRFGTNIHNFDFIDHYNDIQEVAALCAALDFVVSIKTTVPLIAAAVGTRVRLANWRQSPWSNLLHNPVGPSVEIYERNTWDPWDATFSKITDDLLTELKK